MFSTGFPKEKAISRADVYVYIKESSKRDVRMKNVVWINVNNVISSCCFLIFTYTVG